MRHIFIIGSKGIPGAYGGYETFVDKLTEYHESLTDITYHVACKDIKSYEEYYHGARCFHISVPNIGAAQAVYYDIAALRSCIKYIKENKIANPIVYILACRIGPFVSRYKKQITKLGGKLYINPDGHEWKRAKWPLPIKKYWKLSEKLMVKHADLIVCDSKNIESYIHKEYASYKLNTTYIAYGAEVYYKNSSVSPKLQSWYHEKGLKANKYYLVVGRFVPENNYETMIREFMKSKTDCDLALITNVNDNFLNALKQKTNYHNDSRIKFVGTVYDQELLQEIRANAYGYLHGHEVGGTNPSLLEALGSTSLNLLLDVGFNRECAEDGALYWTKESGNLASVLEIADKMNEKQVEDMGKVAKSRIKDNYSWKFIADQYMKIFEN